MAFLFFLEISILSLGDKESRGEVRTPRFCLSPRGILPKNQNGINRFYWIESAPRMSEPVAPPPPPGPPPPPAFDDGAEKKRKRDTYYDKQEVPRTPTASPLQPPAVAAKAAATPPPQLPTLSSCRPRAGRAHVAQGTQSSHLPTLPHSFPHSLPLDRLLSHASHPSHFTPSHPLSRPLTPSHPLSPFSPHSPCSPHSPFSPLSTHFNPLPPSARTWRSSQQRITSR